MKTDRQIEKEARIIRLVEMMYSYIFLGSGFIVAFMIFGVLPISVATVAFYVVGYAIPGIVEGILIFGGTAISISILLPLATRLESWINRSYERYITLEKENREFQKWKSKRRKK